MEVSATHGLEMEAFILLDAALNRHAMAIAELRAAGVSERRINVLYPFEVKNYSEGLYQALASQSVLDEVVEISQGISLGHALNPVQAGDRAIELYAEAGILVTRTHERYLGHSLREINLPPEESADLIHACQMLYRILFALHLLSHPGAEAGAAGYLEWLLSPMSISDWYEQEVLALLDAFGLTSAQQ